MVIKRVIELEKKLFLLFYFVVFDAQPGIKKILKSFSPIFMKKT